MTSPPWCSGAAIMARVPSAACAALCSGVSQAIDGMSFRTSGVSR